MFSWEIFFFFFFATLLVFTSLMVIILRNPLSCAFFLVLSFVNLAGLYVMLEAHFLAAAQILVYAGAIMVLFIFVIMLLNLGREQKGLLDKNKQQILAVFAGGATFLGMFFVYWKSSPKISSDSVAQNFGTIQAVGQIMFSKYLIPFEIVGVFLLVAAVGAVLLAKRTIMAPAYTKI